MENGLSATLESAPNHTVTDTAALSSERREEPQLANADELKHNHGPNFGRHKDGCPRCESIAAGIIDKRKARPSRAKNALANADLAKAKAELAQQQRATAEAQRLAAEAIAAQAGVTPAQTVTLTFEQLQQLMAGQMDGFKEAIIEMKKPDPEEAEKKRIAKERMEQRKIRRIAEIKSEEDMKAMRKQNCSHLKENGKSNIVKGQVYSGGYYVPMCLGCMSQFDKIPVRIEEFAGAIG